MLSIGSFRASACNGVTRRAFLTAGAALPAVLALGKTSPLAAAPKVGRARSTVLVWLWGAPSHLDTFDPKPHAPVEYRGPFGTIATRTPSLRVTELLPRLAARSHWYSLARSHVTHSGGHPDAGTYALTGYAEGPGPLHPNFGSIVARHRGAGKLPPFIMLGRGIPKDVVRSVSGSGGGDWGKAYDPFLLNCTELGETEIPSLKLLEGLSPGRLADRRLLKEQLDRIQKSMTADQFDSLNRAEQGAYTLLTSREAIKALDLSAESEDSRAAYGQTSFGQSLLLARRLVEASVPYIHVNWSEYVEALTPNTDFGWDTHIHNFDLLPTRHCPIFDRAFSAFLDDLHQRGLSDSTLVCCMGEFGRTPKINNRASRDHWPQCYFSLWSGGGIKPGRVIGASDKLGEHPISEPIQPADVGVTIMDQMGIDSVARAELKALPGGKAIHELL